MFDYTSPQNGRYVLRLPVNSTHTLRVEASIRDTSPSNPRSSSAVANVTHNVQVPVSTDDCSGAPGYVFASDGEYQTFDSESTPDGWSVVDNLGNGQVWTFDDPGGRGNITGGTGGFAIVDSDAYGPGDSQDTSLVSPVVDLTGVAEPVLRFNQNYNAVSSDDTAATSTSASTEVRRGPTSSARPPTSGVRWRSRSHRRPASPTSRSGSTTTTASFAWWWAVDNVLIGSEVTCEPTNGGLVKGHVRDLNDNEPINGATVRSNAEPNDSGITMATPEDNGQPDGFYWLFSSLTGRRELHRWAHRTTSRREASNVQNHGVRRRGFILAAGHLVVEPT